MRVNETEEKHPCEECQEDMELDCREDCCGNCEHSIKTDVPGFVICQ